MAAPHHHQFRVNAADFAAFLVPVLLIVFLALSNGGFDPIARTEVGVALWWAVLLGTALNLLPAAGGTRFGRVLLVVATAFAGWTALSFTWTESDERTATELARVSSYLAVFALALAVQGAGRWRRVLHGVTTGVVIVCALAVLSRMQPSWFPEQIAGEYLVGIQIESRLAYPLNYPSGLGALAAIGFPLALAGAHLARTAAAQALYAAAIPIIALTLWLTSSGLSVPAAAGALVLFFILAPDRLPKLLTLTIAGAGSGLLFGAVDQRPELDRGLANSVAEKQGDELMAIALLVCAGVGLAHAGVARWARDAQRPAWLLPSRRQTAVASASALVVAVTVGLAAGLPGELSDEWESLKGRGAEVDPRTGSRAAQVLDFSGSGRYDFWESAVDASESDPLKGIGPGTWDLWWARNGFYTAYVRDAHSLYLETLGELGIVGLVLIAGFSLGVLGLGAWRALRAPPELRLAIAAATAGCGGFAAAALVDWMWEMGVLAMIFFCLAAIACAGGVETRRGPATGGGVGFAGVLRGHGGRIAVCALALAGIAAIVQPLWGAVELERSYDAVADGRPGDALDHARDAASIQPYAATPRMQEALLLTERDQHAGAVKAAREATRNEPTNWQTWEVLAKVQKRAGDDEAAAEARSRAASLEPGSGAPAGE